VSTARTRRGEARRDAIVDAAAALLLTGGVRAVAHRPVAAAAAVPLGSTTYYFADRDDLVAAAVHRAGEIEAERARAALAAPRRGARSARAIARRLVDVVVGLDRCADPAVVGALYERIVEAAREPATREAARGWNDAVRSVVGELLADEGLALTPDVALALVDGSVVGWLPDGGDASALVDRVAAGLTQVAGPA
jgi:DNA-binding transcriptional regulator YbjK